MAGLPASSACVNVPLPYWLPYWRWNIADGEATSGSASAHATIRYVTGAQSISMPIKNVLREDEVRPSLPVEEVLANAPEPVGDFFSVPKIIDEGEGA